ncbi:MAG TPA: efflux RND transporter periplasmic adaptor subunit [Thalassobaculum sp.]
MRQLTLVLRAAACVAAASVLAACDQPPPQAAPTGGPPVTVAKPLVKEIIEWDEYTGQFAPVEYVEVRARVSGYLESIHFEDGQAVKAGDKLFVIDRRPFEIALESARARVAQTSARVELARQQLSRARQLLDRQNIPAETYDERVQELRVAGADLEIAQADVRSAELNLTYTEISAPVSGRVSLHSVSVGNLVSGGAGDATTLLTTIVAFDPIHFYFDISEANFLAYQRAIADGRLKPNREGDVSVNVRLFDEQGWARTGALNFIDNQVDRTAGTIRARATFANPGFFITPGQFGRLRLPGSELHPAVMIPDSAIVSDQSNKLVMVVAADGTVQPRVIRPGPRELGLRIVRDGLGADDSIIIDGLLRARPGSKVTAQPGKIEPGPDRAR